MGAPHLNNNKFTKTYKKVGSYEPIEVKLLRTTGV